MLGPCDGVVLHNLRFSACRRHSRANVKPCRAVSMTSCSSGVPLREARENFEREYLKVQIRRFSGNISKTATFIGMERSALHRKLKLLGMAERMSALGGRFDLASCLGRGTTVRVTAPLHAR